MAAEPQPDQWALAVLKLHRISRAVRLLLLAPDAAVADAAPCLGREAPPFCCDTAVTAAAVAVAADAVARESLGPLLSMLCRLADLPLTRWQCAIRRAETRGLLAR